MRLNYKRLFSELILALSKVLDINESEKFNHAQRTAVLSYLLAENFCANQTAFVYYAALLHDIGGIGLFNHIVHHPSPTAQAANPAIRVHPVVGAQIVNNIPSLEPCVPIILSHHERYDGRGYPAGKKNSGIPIGAQVLRGADSFDIQLHRETEVSSKRLIKFFADTAQQEVSKEISDQICSYLSDSTLFSQLTDATYIQEKCKELNNTLTGIELPLGKDIIGTLLEVFAQVIDTKHAYTAGHSTRVARYSIHIGLAFGLEHDEITRLKWAALVHDLGKIGVPQRILDGDGPLSKEEFEIIRQHPKYTIEVLSCVSEMKDLAYLGAYHHERWDGKGYPNGLEGEAIPLHSRMICIADAFDSLTSDRSYRKGVGTKEALDLLAKASGTQFDSQLFSLAKKVLWSGTD